MTGMQDDLFSGSLGELDALVSSVELAPAGSDADPSVGLLQVALQAVRIQRQLTAVRIQALRESGDDLDPLAIQAVLLDAFDRLESLCSASKMRAMAQTFTDADRLLTDPDATPGGVREHPGHEHGNDRYLTRLALAASVVGPVLGMGSLAAKNRIHDAVQLHTLMPNALDRVRAGDWSGYHAHIVASMTRHLDAETITALDADLHTTAGRVPVQKVSRRIEAWLVRRGLPLEADSRRRAGADDRHIRFGPTDSFGMRDIHASLRAIDATAIQTAISDLAATRETTDPRTQQQVEADVFVAMLTGPAALAPGVAAHLGAHEALIDPESGYARVDTQQAADAAEIWSVIITLAATLGLTFARPPAAHISTTVPYATLLALRAGIVPGTGPNAPPTTDADDTEPDPRAWVPGIGYLDHHVLTDMLAGDITMQRIITDDDTGAPLDVGPARRWPPAAMRTRVLTRDRHCRFPGCHRELALDLDHIQAWSADGKGGPTADANLQALCREHHRVKHQTHWSPILHADGHITWRNNLIGLTLVTSPGDR